MIQEKINSLVNKVTREVNMTDDSDNFKFLSSLTEFKHIPADDIRELSQFSHVITYNQNDLIVIEGEEESPNGFIIISGSVSVFKTSQSGKELIVELIQAKDMFGVIILLTKNELLAQLSARALQKVTVLSVPIKKILNILSSHPVIYKEFTSHLLLSLQSSYRLSRGLAHDRVEVRIASVLISLALKFTVANPTLKAIIRFTRQQLADLTGTTPETAIRTTRSMQKDGLIDISRPGIIKIIDMDGISELVDRHIYM